MLGVALAGGGCSMTYRLDSWFNKEAAAAPDATNSVAQRPRPAAAEEPSDADLALAKSAAADVLARGGKDASAPWENPQTGARGTVTPIATAYSQAGLMCRDFLASYVRNGTESWLQGEACRIAQGKWEVRQLKPLRNS